MAKEEDKEMDEETVYDKEGREELVSDDELSPEEEGFMRGYEESDESEKKKEDEEEEEKE